MRHRGDQWLEVEDHSVLALLPVGVTVAEDEIRQQSIERQNEAARIGRSAFDNLSRIFSEYRDTADPDQWDLEKFSLSINAQASPADAARLGACLAALDRDEVLIDVTAEIYLLCREYMANGELTPFLDGLVDLAANPAFGV